MNSALPLDISRIPNLRSNQIVVVAVGVGVDPRTNRKSPVRSFYIFWGDPVHVPKLRTVCQIIKITFFDKNRPSHRFMKHQLTKPHLLNELSSIVPSCIPAYNVQIIPCQRTYPSSATRSLTCTTCTTRGRKARPSDPPIFVCTVVVS